MVLMSEGGGTPYRWEWDHLPGCLKENKNYYRYMINGFNKKELHTAQAGHHEPKEITRTKQTPTSQISTLAGMGKVPS